MKLATSLAMDLDDLATLNYHMDVAVLYMLVMFAQAVSYGMIVSFTFLTLLIPGQVLLP